MDLTVGPHMILRWRKIIASQVDTTRNYEGSDWYQQEVIEGRDHGKLSAQVSCRNVIA